MTMENDNYGAEQIQFWRDWKQSERDLVCT